MLSLHFKIPMGYIAYDNKIKQSKVFAFIIGQGH